MARIAANDDLPWVCRVCRGKIGLRVQTCTCPTVGARGFVGDGLFPREDSLIVSLRARIDLLPRFVVNAPLLGDHDEAVAHHVIRLDDLLTILDGIHDDDA